MRPMHGKVPQFSMRPHPVVTGLFFVILVVGLLLSLSFLSQDEGTGTYRQRAMFTMLVTALSCTFLAIVATSKFWFPHLWKKNSTHDRHKQHTHHHPAVRAQRQQQRRHR